MTGARNNADSVSDGKGGSRVSGFVDEGSLDESETYQDGAIAEAREFPSDPGVGAQPVREEWTGRRREGRRDSEES